MRGQGLCWRLLPLIARPGADQTELITVGSGGYGTDWLAGWLAHATEDEDPFGDVDDVIDDRSGHTHQTKTTEKTASLLDEYVNLHTASRMMSRRLNRSVNQSMGFFSTLQDNCRTAAWSS